MNYQKWLLMLCIAASDVLMTWPAYAASENNVQAEALQMAVGEIKKIDRDNTKLTIKHGPILNLDMPGMTMSFRVKDQAMLDNLQVNDKVHFIVERVNGVLTITRLEVQGR